MENGKSILKDLWRFIRTEKEKTKIAKKVYKWMDKDNLGTFVVFEGNYFDFQTTNSYTRMPNYVYDYLKKWGEKQGYTYLIS